MSSQLLGLIDAIESTLLDSKRIPLTDQMIISEKVILPMLQKLRQLAQNETSIPKRLQTSQRDFEKPQKPKYDVGASALSPEARSIIEKAKKIESGADHYAHEVLTQLQIVATLILRQIKNSKKQLEDKK